VSHKHVIYLVCAFSGDVQIVRNSPSSDRRVCRNWAAATRNVTSRFVSATEYPSGSD
jgi:hypothetical protein